LRDRHAERDSVDALLNIEPAARCAYFPFPFLSRGKEGIMTNGAAA
jgi:hypothetical protein